MNNELEDTSVMRTGEETEDGLISDPILSDLDTTDIISPESSEPCLYFCVFLFLTSYSAPFKAFLNLLDDSIDRAITDFEEGLVSRKLLKPHFDPQKAQIACHSILRRTENGSTAMSMVCDIPKFWINLDGLAQSSNLNSIESTITRVFCMQGALKFYYWLLDIVPKAIDRISNPNHKPKSWIDRLVTDVQSSMYKEAGAMFDSSNYLPNLAFHRQYKMVPTTFTYNNSNKLNAVASSILRFWLHFPDEEDYLVRPTLLDIVTTNLPPSILFLDKIWEMYRTPFSTIFNNNWDVRRSNAKLSKGLADFKKEFGIHPFTITGSSSHDKLETLSELIYKWMQFSGVDSNTAEIVSRFFNNQSILI